MWFGIISLFPECLKTLEFGIPSRAQAQGLIEIACISQREFADNKHRYVDDRPYGGGPGMVLQAPPLAAAIDAAKALKPQAKVIYLTPQGRRLDQAGLQELVQNSALILVCGRYEGVDQRVVDTKVDECWSIGDYVLSGGELAALVLIDGITRLLPGALGDENSALEDSFMAGLLDCPHYTRPEVYAGLKVPAVLQSGDHAAIKRWRLQQALGLTWLHRPDLLEKLTLDAKQDKLLKEFIRDYQEKQRLGENDD